MLISQIILYYGIDNASPDAAKRLQAARAGVQDYNNLSAADLDKQMQMQSRRNQGLPDNPVTLAQFRKGKVDLSDPRNLNAVKTLMQGQQMQHDMMSRDMDLQQRKAEIDQRQAKFDSKMQKDELRRNVAFAKNTMKLTDFDTAVKSPSKYVQSLMQVLIDRAGSPAEAKKLWDAA